MGGGPKTSPHHKRWGKGPYLIDTVLFMFQPPVSNKKKAPERSSEANNDRLRVYQF